MSKMMYRGVHINVIDARDKTIQLNGIELRWGSVSLVHLSHPVYITKTTLWVSVQAMEDNGFFQSKNLPFMLIIQGEWMHKIDG